MSTVPPPTHSTLEAIMSWRAKRDQGDHRPHLGGSLIGHVCDRYLWLTFRWAAKPSHNARILRLFDSGKREEPRVMEELRGVGCEVWDFDENGRQIGGSDVGGHFGLSLDGVLMGVLEAPKTPHNLEIKTHSAKSFADLVKKGVKASKPQHYAQMQIGMEIVDLERSLYYAVNKDTDELYIERIERDRTEGKRLRERARRIIESSEPPPKIAPKANGDLELDCSWCQFKDLCHGNQAPEVNCRTCCHATPDVTRDGGKWKCGAGNDVLIPIQHQRTGCDQHLYIPPLLSNIGEPIDGGQNYVVYRQADGREFINGPQPGFSSKEIEAGMVAPQLLTDPLVQDLKKQFPTTRLVGAQALVEMPNDLDVEPTKKTRKKAAA